MKIKTAELTGVALDWAVARCEGLEKRVQLEGDSEWGITTLRLPMLSTYAPSTCWEQGGAILEREKITTVWDTFIDSWKALDERCVISLGQTPLVAAMRCYVASRLGDEVEIPEVLA